MNGSIRAHSSQLDLAFDDGKAHQNAVAAPQESLALAKKARAEAAAYFQTLDAKQQLGLELQVRTCPFM